MDVRRLRMFLAVVDQGTFTRAAAAQFVSQPGLSQAIRELEAEVGVALFARLARGVELTEAGRVLVGPARQIMRDLSAAGDAVAAIRELVSGRLDIGSLPTLAADPTARLVGTFRRAHPGVVVSMANPETPDDLLIMVANGVVELAVTEAPQGTSDLAVIALGPQEMCVVMPPGSLAPSRRMTTADLAALGWVTTRPGTSTRRVLDEAVRRTPDAESAATPTVSVETAQREALLPLVLAGAGAALLPRATADLAATLGAVIAKTRQPLYRDIALVHRRGPLSPAASRFVALASVA